MAKLLIWIELDCAGVHNKVTSECVLKSNLSSSKY